MSNVLYVAVCLIVGAIGGAFATIISLVLIEDIISKKENKDEKDS